MSARVRLMTNNLLTRATVVNGINASSQVAGFEGTNVYDENRWKEWLSAGGFEVDSANNKVYINDGADKTVAIPVAQYGTAAALAAAAETQLNSDSSGWTVSYDATAKTFTFTHATATLRFSQTTDAAWDMLGYTGSSDTAATGGLEADEVRIHTSEFLVWDLVTNAPAPKALLMTGEADEEFDWQSASIRVRADNVSILRESAAPLDVTLTPEQFGAYKFWSGADETGYRFWRIDFTDRTNADGPNFAVNQMYLGPYFEPEEFNLNVGFSRTLVDPRTTVKSDSGARYHRRRRKYWVYGNLVLANIQDDDREELERIAQEIGASTPFWIALDPDGAISKSVGEFTKYVEFEADFASDHVLYKRYTDRFSVVEVV